MVLKFRSLFRQVDYKRYKKTTWYVRQRLAEFVPFPIETVSDFAKAADCIYRSTIQSAEKARAKEELFLDKRSHENLIEKLEETIALRQLVSATYGKDSDDKHRHMIHVLKYCHEKLRKIPNEFLKQDLWTKVGIAFEKNSKEEAVEEPIKHDDLKKFHCNTFESLSSADDDSVLSTVDELDCECCDDDDDEEEEADDLFGGDRELEKWFFRRVMMSNSVVEDIKLFVLEIHSLFSLMQKHYESLQESISSSACSVTNILGTTSAMNYLLQSMRSLEESFLLKHGGKSSVLELFAIYIFPMEVLEMEVIVGPKFVGENPSFCQHFCHECFMIGLDGASSDGESYIKRALQRHIGENDLTSKQTEELEEVGWSICVSVESLVFENSSVDSEKQVTTLSDQSIDTDYHHNGIECLKELGWLSGPSGLLRAHAALRAYLLRSHNEDQNKIDTATKAVHDKGLVDMCSELFALCNIDSFSGGEPVSDRETTKILGIFPLFQIVERFDRKCKAKTKLDVSKIGLTVPFAIASAYHGQVILGDHCRLLKVMSSLVFGKFGQQMKEVLHLSRIDSLGQSRYKIVRKIKAAQDAIINWSDNVNCFWSNPFLAGSALLVTVEYCNIRHALVTDRETLSVPFLYYCLRERGLIQQIDALDALQRGTDMVGQWRGGKPKMGDFLKCFLIVTGAKPRSAHDMTTVLKRKGRKKQKVNMRKVEQLVPKEHVDTLHRMASLSSISRRHKEDPYRPEIIQLQMQEFFPEGPKFLHEVEDLQSSPLEIKLAQCYVLRERVHTEENLMKIHWTCAWSHCDVFICRAIDELGLSYAATYLAPKSWLLADFVFRELDLETDPMKCHNSRKIAALMTKYFTTDASLKSIALF